MTPGYLTTEFWVAIVTAVLGMLISSGVLPADFPQEQVVGAVIGLVGLIAYILGRSWTKAAYWRDVPPPPK